MGTLMNFLNGDIRKKKHTNKAFAVPGQYTYSPCQCRRLEKSGIGDDMDPWHFFKRLDGSIVHRECARVVARPSTKDGTLMPARWHKITVGPYNPQTMIAFDAPRLQTSLYVEERIPELSYPADELELTSSEQDLLAIVRSTRRMTGELPQVAALASN